MGTGTGNNLALSRHYGIMVKHNVLSQTVFEIITHTKKTDKTKLYLIINHKLLLHSDIG